MNEKSKYFKIGVFLLAGIVLLIAGIIIVGGGEVFKEKIIMETCFDSSVQGIDVGTPIKFRGYKIGEVKDIMIASDVYDLKDSGDVRKYGLYIVVRCALDAKIIDRLNERLQIESSDFLVDRGLRVQMVPLGVTGLSFLEVDFVNILDYPLLGIGWEPKYMYIPSIPSTMQTIAGSFHGISKATEQLPQIMERLNDSLAHVNAALAEGRGDVQESLDNIRMITNDIKDITLELKQYPSNIIFGGPPQKQEVEP